MVFPVSPVNSVANCFIRLINYPGMISLFGIILQFFNGAGVLFKDFLKFVSDRPINYAVAPVLPVRISRLADYPEE